MLSKRREKEEKNAKLFSEELSVCVCLCVDARVCAEWGEPNRRASEIKGMSKRDRWGAERVRKRKHEVQKQRGGAGMIDRKSVV